MTQSLHRFFRAWTAVPALQQQQAPIPLRVPSGPSGATVGVQAQRFRVLANSGNTCYPNSVFQALLAVQFQGLGLGSQHLSPVEPFRDV